MFLISKIKQAQNKLCVTPEVEKVEMPSISSENLGGLTVRTDLRAGAGWLKRIMPESELMCSVPNMSLLSGGDTSFMV